MLNYRTWGDPSHPPILMLHGHPGRGQSLAVFGEAVQDQWWAIAPDLRGYGQSPAPDPFVLQDHLTDLRQLLAHLQIDQCLLLGWSLGGILALELALAEPARFPGLVLVASAARPRGNHPPITVWDNLWTGVASLLNGLVPGWEWNITTFGQRSLYRYLIQQHTPATYRILAREALPAYLQTSAHARQALSQALRQRYSVLDRLGTLSQPALVLAAAQDYHITAAASQETAAALPHATCHVYPQAGHLFPWEIPDQVQQDVNHWLDKQFGSVPKL